MTDHAAGAPPRKAREDGEGLGNGPVHQSSHSQKAVAVKRYTLQDSYVNYVNMPYH